PPTLGHAAVASRGEGVADVPYFAVALADRPRRTEPGPTQVLRSSLRFQPEVRRVDRAHAALRLLRPERLPRPDSEVSLRPGPAAGAKERCGFGCGGERGDPGLGDVVVPLLLRGRPTTGRTAVFTARCVDRGDEFVARAARLSHRGVARSAHLRAAHR